MADDQILQALIERFPTHQDELEQEPSAPKTNKIGALAPLKKAETIGPGRSESAVWDLLGLPNDPLTNRPHPLSLIHMASTVLGAPGEMTTEMMRLQRKMQQETLDRVLPALAIGQLKPAAAVQQMKMMGISDVDIAEGIERVFANRLEAKSSVRGLLNKPTKWAGGGVQLPTTEPKSSVMVEQPALLRTDTMRARTIKNAIRHRDRINPKTVREWRKQFFGDPSTSKRKALEMAGHDIDAIESLLKRAQGANSRIPTRYSNMTIDELREALKDVK